MCLPFICIFMISFVIVCDGNEELPCRFVMQRLFRSDTKCISETARCGDLTRVKSLLQLFMTSINFHIDNFINDCTSPILLRSNVTQQLPEDQKVPFSTGITEEMIIECIVVAPNQSRSLFYHLRESELDLSTITYFPSIFVPNLSNATTAYVSACNVTNIHFTERSEGTLLENLPGSEVAQTMRYLRTEETIISLKIHQNRVYVHSFSYPLSRLTRRVFVILNHKASDFLYYGILNNLTALEVFDISKNGLFSVPENLLLYNNQLSSCDLSYNTLREIPQSFFKYTKMLKNLRLDHNQLKMLSPYLFLNNKELEVLLLNHNQLQTLPKDLFKNNFKVSKLYLNSNFLSDLPRTLFPRNVSLIELNLSHNQLTSLNLTLLEDPTERRIGEIIKFGYQPELHITESYNEDDKVDLNTTLKTNILRALNVSHNRLRNLPKDFFKQSQVLSFFDGSYNPEIFGFTNSHFLYSLEIITFTDCNIKYIEGALTNSVSSYTSLINLVEFSRNKITAIDSTAFRNCRNLEVIFLKYNQLKRLEPGLFKDLDRLYYLDLSENMLYTLPYQLFSVQSLLHLNVSRNHISNFGPSPLVTVLQSFTSRLRVLDLSNNCLTSSEIAPLNFNVDTPLYLIYINLEFNALVNIPRIPTVQKGYYVYLGHNAITDIETSNLEKQIYTDIEFYETKSKLLLMTTPERVLISLCPNPLKRICKFRNTSCEGITQERLHGLPKELLHVDVESCYDSYEMGENYTLRNFQDVNFGCPFTPTCPKRYYQSVSCYENASCDLQSRLVCPITESCPSQCDCYEVGFEQITLVNCRKRNLMALPLFVPPKTAILHFEHNKLRNLPQFTVSAWSHLTELYLDNNQISEAYLPHLPHTLKKLSMRHNRLATLDINGIENFIHLQIWLGGNPWLCDCSALDLKTLIQSSEIIADGKDILCNRTKRSLVDEEEICTEKIKRATSISLAVSISILLPMFVGIIAIFYYRNKRTITAYVFTHHPRIFGCFCSIKQLEEQKRFDAFISYSGFDTDVVKQFIEQLEEREPHFSLCIHERDWIPGDDISINIANSVCMSRKTILILSKEFLQSIWFSVELHSAYYQSVEDRVDRLIIVLKGDLPPLNTLNVDLQVLIKTKTYLVWGEKWFWEKLRYALSQSKA